MVDEWKGYLSLPDYDRYLGTIPVMKKQIEALCKLRLEDKQKRFLFVVDDLDRCSHTGVVKALEAVRLVMGLKQVVVIIAIDQRIALASLALHYKDLAGHHDHQDPSIIARDYLGKVIQLPVQLHAADEETVTAFIDQVLLNGEGETSEKDRQQATKVKNADIAIDESVLATNQQFEQLTQKVDVEKKVLTETPSEKVSAVEKTEYQLSPSEKQAFKERVKHFKFHNPRQLKRLYNSFNLLRHLLGSDQADDHMLVLFWLEYLNSLPPKERMVAKEKWDAFALLNERFKDDEARYKTVKRYVKPFVLPALGSCDVNEIKKNREP